MMMGISTQIDSEETHYLRLSISCQLWPSTHVMPIGAGILNREGEKESQKPKCHPVLFF